MWIMSLLDLFLGNLAFELYQFIFMPENTHINQDIIHGELPFLSFKNCLFKKREQGLLVATRSKNKEE